MRVLPVRPDPVRAVADLDHGVAAALPAHAERLEGACRAHQLPAPRGGRLPELHVPAAHRGGLPLLCGARRQRRGGLGRTRERGVLRPGTGQGVGGGSGSDGRRHEQRGRDRYGPSDHGRVLRKHERALWRMRPMLQVVHTGRPVKSALFAGRGGSPTGGSGARESTARGIPRGVRRRGQERGQGTGSGNGLRRRARRVARARRRRGAPCGTPLPGRTAFSRAAPRRGASPSQASGPARPAASRHGSPRWCAGAGRAAARRSPARRRWRCRRPRCGRSWGRCAW